MKITPEQFYQQWAPGGSTQPIISRFERQLFDFITIAGDTSRDHFKQSFREKGFAGTGTKWPPRKLPWVRRFPHPMMNDEGRLLESIKSNPDRMKYGEMQKKSKVFNLKKNTRISAKGSTKKYTEKGKIKRGINPHSDGSYAAVHNQPTEGRTQRQFMGYNKALDAKIAAFIPDIFKNLPPLP